MIRVGYNFEPESIVLSSQIVVGEESAAAIDLDPVLSLPVGDGVFDVPVLFARELLRPLSGAPPTCLDVCRVGQARPTLVETRAWG
ncbi:MAG: hypothetical protein MK538_02370 [Planctomycetes bacterium]|nr:hypothetical protein [Planctomycetota bacterium]